MGVPLSQARFELMGFYYTPAMVTSALKNLLHLAGLYFPYDWLQTILVKEQCREAIYRQPESFSLKVQIPPEPFPLVGKPHHT